jgi:hypothetical protein
LPKRPEIQRARAFFAITPCGVRAIGKASCQT